MKAHRLTLTQLSRNTAVGLILAQTALAADDEQIEWQPMQVAQAEYGSAASQSSNTATPSKMAAAQDPAASSATAALEEVIVTAQLRSESLQDVPVSLQVIGEETLAQQNINSLSDVTKIAPSVQFSGSGRSDNLTLRGISTGAGQSFDQSVGLFIDGIYHGRSRTTTSTFLDLERVEILKGPQSTFFGNNAIAGAFNIVTAKPGSSFEAWTRALYGDDGQYVLEGAAGGAVSETLGIRAAATFNGGDGWVRNVNTGRDQPDRENMAARLTLLFTPSDDLQASWKIEAGHNSNHSGLFLQVDDCPPAAPFSVGPFCEIALAQQVPIGVDTKNSESPGQEIRLNTTDSVLTINYERWNHTLTSVSGYYGYRYDMNFDADALPVSLFHIQAPEEYDQFSQEFRVASPTGQPLEYLAGVYYQTGDLFFRQDFAPYFLNGIIASTPPFAPLVPYLPLGQDTNYKQREDSYAVFGAVTWHATDRLKIGAGLRGSWVDKKYVWNSFYGTATRDYGGIVSLPADLQSLAALLGLGVPGNLRGDRSDNAWMPSAKVQYDIHPAAMVYASYARGFKAGGFNGADLSGDAANLPFDPEFVTAYEIGLKSEWLDRKLLANLALFRMDYEDLQVSVDEVTANGAILAFVRNAATARAQGVELEGQWLIGNNLRLATAVTYLDAEYTKYVVSSSVDFTGDQLGPEWSGSLTVTHSVPILRDYQLSTELGGYVVTDTRVDILGRPIGDDVRLDGRITFETQDARWAVDIIGKNLTDATFYNFYSQLVLSPGSSIAQLQQPRNFAIQFRYRWN